MSTPEASISDQFTELLELAKEAKARLLAAQNGSTSEHATPPPFPVDILPPVLRRYVDEAAASLPVPPEMIALPMIVMAGSLVGNRVHFQLKRGWYEYPTLFMVVVARPGQNKSPAIKLARAPLQAIQRDAKKQYQLAYEAYEEELRRWKARPQKERGDEPRPPRMRDVYTTDVTLEALASMLERTPGLVISTDEMSGWIRRMNQYRQGGDREQYMSIWAGEPIKVDRKSAGGSVYVDRPVIGVFGGIQPDVVPTLHSESQVRDGFVDRILPFIPALPAKTWNRDAVISEDAESGAINLYRAIDNILPLVSSEDIGAPGIGVQMDREADQEWARWSNDNNALAAELGGFLGGYYTKLEAHVARFALILHILSNPSDPRPMITANTMRGAIDLGEFFRGQMQLFLPLLVSNATTSTRQAGLLNRIERFIRRKGRTVETSKCRDGETCSTVEALCVGSNELYRGLGVRKEEVTRELDTQNDSRDIWVTTLPTGNNPTQAYCLLTSTVEEIAEVRHFDGPTVRQSDEVRSPASSNGHTEPIPVGCGAPGSCSKLGPCHVYQEHGRCWSAQTAEVS